MIAKFFISGLGKGRNRGVAVQKQVISFVLILTGLVAARAQAEEQQRPLESSRFYARGNTYVAGYDTDEGTRGNPATLSETNIKFQLRFFQMDMLVGENSVDSISDLAEIDAESSAISMLQTFEDKFGKRQYGRVQLAPLALRILWFELTPFISTANFVDMRLPTIPEVEFYSDTMAGANFSFGFPVGKTLNFGLTMRPAHRTVYTGNMGFGDLVDVINSDDVELGELFEKREGFQIGWDTGMIWKPSAAWRLGLLVENLGYAGNQGGFKAPPKPYQQRVNLGMNYRVDWKPWHWDMLMDMQDLVNPQGYHPLQLLHIGTEIGRSYISRDHDIGLLAGINEGYLTMGTFVDVFVARLQMTYYAVELGEYPGQRKDRRWGITLLSSMTF
jgi:hypothetical protein